ncbi:uncharacterized protein LOC129225162 [Uloborus diversus]|uniref:uncharacterized protein LOC129225162 n=1 Tax=Uloborus diversus TaxID=327109 RepID=UPI00240A1FA1|nr:uncharacterized protein LOC129225162 [Uloborus diversus]
MYRLTLSSIFYICLSLICISSATEWQHQESGDFNEDAFPVMSSTWQKSLDKRNTWWTKKSIRDEDISEGCLVRCLVQLTDCLQQGENRALYFHCNDHHISCVTGCLKEYRKGLAIKNADIPSRK